MKRAKWGILGTGHIVDKMGPAIRRSGNGRLWGIAGRDEARSRLAARKHHAKRTYPSYEALVNDPEIDIIYIALLNHLHREWALRAIQAGKHVLVEKPFALNAEEAEAIRQAAERKGVKVMEAHVWRFDPAHRYVRAAISSGVIGDPAHMLAHFSFPIRPGSTRLVRDWGGGALYDIGCYTVAWSRFVFNEEPVLAENRLHIDPEHEVDLRCSGTLIFPGGQTSQISAAFDLSGGSFYKVIGSNGVITLNMDANPKTLNISVMVNGEAARWSTDRIEPYVRQAESFAECVLLDRPVFYDAEDAVCNMKVMDALFEADRKKTPVLVERVAKPID